MYDEASAPDHRYSPHQPHFNKARTQLIECCTTEVFIVRNVKLCYLLQKTWKKSLLSNKSSAVDCTLAMCLLREELISRKY